MTAVKLLPLGGSLGFELPDDIRDRLKLKAGDVLWLDEAEDGTLRISSASPNHAEQMRLAREGMSAYRDALRELAK
jgi:putative addiction module antidote